jgi:hypothetical protein
MSDQLLDALGRSTGAVVLATVLVVGAAVGLGISIRSADQFFNLREWTQAIGHCLRSL